MILQILMQAYKMIKCTFEKALPDQRAEERSSSGSDEQEVTATVQEKLFSKVFRIKTGPAVKSEMATRCPAWAESDTSN